MRKINPVRNLVKNDDKIAISNGVKAISLVSGGLDSTLATKLILEQGIDITAVNFTSPFCLCNKKASKAHQGCFSLAKIMSEDLNLPLKLFSLGAEYLEMIKKPKFGYGANMNPCIDCRIMIFSKAKEYMNEIGASFIITGEVVSQRPMSQYRHTLLLIEKESNLSRLILRPLSAKLLPITIPEEKEWVSREKLLKFNGRTRKPQIALAKDLGINEYPCSSGGCLLTDVGFTQRLRDLMKHSEANLEEIKLLKVGRHFRLTSKDKLVVGRNAQENAVLLNLAKETDFIFEPLKVNGPVALGRGDGFNDGLLDLASSIVARYCDKAIEEKAIIKVSQRTQDTMQELLCQSIKEESLNKFRI